MPVTTCDAVVVGAGPNGLVAANAPRRRRLGRRARRGAGRGRRGGAQRRERGAGLRHRPVQRLLPAGRGQPGDPRPRTSSSTASPGAMPPTWWPTPSPTAGAPCSAARRATPHPAWTAHHAGDGDAWLRMVAGWDRIRDPLLDALFTPFPPVRPGAAPAAALGSGRHPRPRPARPALGAPPGPGGVRQRGGAGRCSAATRCTATCPRTARAARCSAGCS